MERIRISFWEAVNWKKFFRMVISVGLVMTLLVSIMVTPTWWLVPTITGLVAFMLFLKAHHTWLTNKECNTKILFKKSDIRKEKLKRIGK